MNDNTATTPPEAVIDRFDRITPSLSPEVRAIAFDALEPIDRSLPVALCRTSARAVPGHDPSERTLEGLAVAVGALEGYVSLRTDLVERDRFQSRSERDGAVLAGDYLHALAHATVGDLSENVPRQLELFRVLTNGSNTIACSFADRPDGTGRERTDPRAVLAGVGAALGAVAADGGESTQNAMRTYGYSLSRALTKLAPQDDTERDPKTVAVQVLRDETPDRPTAQDYPSAEGDHDAEPVDSLRARARTSLETLSRVGSNGQPDPTTTDSARKRLERATRVPFVDLPVPDE